MKCVNFKEKEYISEENYDCSVKIVVDNMKIL